MIGIHTKSGLTKLSGGGTDPIILECIRQMQGQIAQLQEAVAGKMDASRIVNGTSVTQEGYAADARQLNPSISGTLAQKVDANKGSIQSVNSDLLSRISTANSNISTISNLLNRFTKGDGCVPIYSGDLNNITNTSIYNCAHSGTTHYPAKWESGYWSFVITLVHTNGSPYCVQVAIVMNASYAQRMATRYKLNNIWNDWAYITVGQ